MKNNEKIIDFRRSLGLTQKEFGVKLGVHYQTIMRYEKGRSKPKSSFYSAVKEHYKVDLLAETNPYPEGAFSLPAESGLKIPVIGICDAGPGISSDIGYPTGYSDEWLSRPAGLRDLNAYALRIPAGAYSMAPALKPGMFCVISPNTECRSGDIAVVKFINGDVTIKEVYFKDNKIELRSYNSDYETKIVDKSELMFSPSPVIWWRRAK